MRFKSIFVLALLSLQFSALTHLVSAQRAEVEDAPFILIDVRWGQPGGSVVEPKPGDKMVPLTITMVHTSPYTITDITAKLVFYRYFKSSTTGDRNAYSPVSGSYDAVEQLDFVFTIDIDDDAELGTCGTSMWIDYRFTFEEERREEYVRVNLELLGRPTVEFLLYPQKLSPGEINDVTLVVANNGSAPAYSLESSFSAEKMVPVDSDTSWVMPRLLPGENVTLPFRLYVHPELQDQVAQGAVTATYSTAYGNTWTKTKEFSFVVTNPFKAKAILIQPNTMNVKAGAINSFSFIITNPRDQDVGGVEVTIEVPQPFGVVGLNSWSIATLIPDESKELTFGLYAPPSSIDSISSIAITVKYLDELGNSNTETLSLGFAVLESLQAQVELASMFPYMSAEIGKTHQFSITVKNSGGSDELFILSVMSSPEGWEAAFKSSAVEVQSVFLTAGQSQTLTVEVTSPEDAMAGLYPVVIQAAPEAGGSKASLGLTVNLKEAEREVEVITTFTDLTVEAGKALQYPITIKNIGDEDTVYLLSVLSVPENWKVAFMSEAIEVSTVHLTAGQSMSLTFKATPPSTVNVGNYTMLIQAKSEDGAIVKQVTLKASIVGAYELMLEPSTLFTEVAVGSSITFTVKVTNEGQSPVTTLSLEVDAPEGWESTVTPVQLSSLAPRDSATFSLTAQTPADTVAGDYIMYIRAMSDQLESDEVQLRVTAQAPTSWGLIGIGIAVFMVIILVFVFRRFRRR